jgi:kynurenine formamidase
MCTPTIVRQATHDFDRRQLLRTGCAAVAGAVLGTGRAPAQAPATPRPLTYTRVADLTHPLTADFPLYPTPANTPFRKSRIAEHAKDGFFANRWELVEHCGTHMDAPCHFVEGQADLDTLPPTDFVAPAAVLDLRGRAGRDPDTAVTVDDLRAWEKQHGRLPDNAAVLLNSGWDAKVKDAKAFRGGERAGALHFPGFSGPAVEFLLNERKIVGIGVDTLSLDVGSSTDFVAHKTLLGAGKWGVECLANLGSIPPVGATVLIGALRVPGASGGPCRVLAAW